MTETKGNNQDNSFRYDVKELIYQSVNCLDLHYLWRLALSAGILYEGREWRIRNSASLRGTKQSYMKKAFTIYRIETEDYRANIKVLK